MRGEDLISEGQSLLRPSLELATEPSDETEATSPGPVGTWRAERSLEAADGETYEHVISVSCEWLRAQGLPVSGTLSLYSDGLDAMLVSDPQLPFDPEAFGGDLLWGTEVPSFPPPDALCLHGSQRVGAWLAERGCSRKDGAAAVIDRTPEGQAYVRKWQRYCPLYEREPPVAVLGGWPIMWPDDGVYEQRGRLVLWTFRDAEPWFEVWIDPAGRLSAVARIT